MQTSRTQNQPTILPSYQPKINKESSPIVNLCLIIAASLATLTISACLFTPFTSSAIYISLFSLASLLILIVLIPIIINLIPTPPISKYISPKDQDLSLLDVRYNRLLHETIKQDLKMEEESKKSSSLKKNRRPSKSSSLDIRSRSSSLSPSESSFSDSDVETPPSLPGPSLVLPYWKKNKNSENKSN